MFSSNVIGANNLGIDINKATPEIVQRAAELDDLNAALVVVQDAIGQRYGDVAGVFFSGDRGDQWPTLSHQARIPVLRAYLDTESCMADPAEDLIAEIMPLRLFNPVSECDVEPDDIRAYVDETPDPTAAGFQQWLQEDRELFSKPGRG